MMRHKYLPRVDGVVLGLGAAVAVGAMLACSDTTGPGAYGPALVLTLETPPSDSLGQLGVALRVARSDSALLKEVRIYVDSTAGTQATSATTYCCSGTGNRFWSVVTFPGPGRHTVTVVGVDTTGRALGASAAWTVRLEGVTYTMAVLPDSGRDGGTRFVHADGTVTGWVGGQNGHRRPAVWRGGALTVLGAIDSLDGTATRVNTAGDVLLEYSRDTVPYAGAGWVLPRGVRVRRADGTTFPVGPNRYARIYPGVNIKPDTVTTCCDFGADLTESRLALGTSTLYPETYPDGASPYASSVLGVARGARVDSMTASFVRLNEAGQGVGSARTAGLYRTTYLVTRGFKPAALPDATPASDCDRVGRFSTLEPVDLDESANVLAKWCGNPVWLPPAGGTSLWLDRVVGRSTAVHLSRTGQIVVSLDTAGAIYLWHPATNRTTQVRIAGGAWRINSLAAVNASGQIAAHGVERATGRAAALLLTPAP